MIARQRGAGRPMTRIGAGPPYGERPRDSARPGAVWGAGDRRVQPLGRRRPGGPGRPGRGDDAGAVARRARLPALRAGRRGRHPDHLAGAGAPPRRRSSTRSPIGGWLTTTARREAWRVEQRVGRRDPGRGRRAGAAASAAALRGGECRAEATKAAGSGRRSTRLPERCRRLLRIVAFENRPDYRELATDLGMPVGSIGPTRGRCLAKLRVALMQAGGVG